jgi:hypothetical protein
LKQGTASYEKSFAVLEHSLFFTNHAFLHFPQRIEDLAEDNDREILHRSVATQQSAMPPLYALVHCSVASAQADEVVQYA